MSKVNWFTKVRKQDTSWAEQPLRFRIYVNMLEFGRRLRALWFTSKLEIILIPIIFGVFYVLSGCITKVVEPSDVVEPDDLADLAEGYCDAHPEFPCGHVYLCEAPSENPENTFGRIEICVNDDVPLTEVEALYGTCAPTPRHSGLCWAPCPVTGPGCNSYDGCYCPMPPMVDAGVMDVNNTLDYPLPEKIKDALTRDR